MPCVVLRSPYPAGTTFQPVIFIAVYCFLGSLFDQTVPSYACPLPASLNLPCSVTGLNGTIVLIFWLALWGFAVSITFALFHNSIPVFFAALAIVHIAFTTCYHNHFVCCPFHQSHHTSLYSYHIYSYIHMHPSRHITSYNIAPCFFFVPM